MKHYYMIARDYFLDGVDYLKVLTEWDTCNFVTRTVLVVGSVNTLILLGFLVF
jgi:hypothetical protein